MRQAELAVLVGQPAVAAAALKVLTEWLEILAAIHLHLQPTQFTSQTETSFYLWQVAHIQQGRMATHTYSKGG